MYSGVNDENNQGAFNDENSLYHYSYSKDREPQPGQPDPSQTSWQPASRPEDPVSPEEPVAYTTGACQDDPQPPSRKRAPSGKRPAPRSRLWFCAAP
ncbi:MAG: hypothetical protein ACLR5H_02270 [Oscillospiraceae bacterium]